MRLTDEVIRKRKPPKVGQAFQWDELVSGFGVRHTPTATAFIIQWREPDGSKRRETLRPRWPTLSVTAARDLARMRLAKVLGTTESGGSVALRLAIRTWYERQTELNAWRPRYRTKVNALISSYIEGEDRPRLKLNAAARAAVAELGRKPVAAVTRTDILRIVDAIRPGAAEQLMAVLSSFFNAMYEREVVTGNPARNRLRVTGGRRIRSRHLSDVEFMSIWRAFAAEGDPDHSAFALLGFTGARRREVTQMQRDELDLAAGTWTLPPERRKTGRKDPTPFVITLHPAARAIIERQPILAGNPFVFWGRRDKRPFDFQHLLINRVRAAAAVNDWRLHDVRRYVRSGMARLGVSQMVAEICLGHIAKSGLVAIYDGHSYNAEKTAAWLKWGDFLASQTGAAK